MTKVTWRGTTDEALETVAFGRHWEANISQDLTEADGFEIEESEPFSMPDGTVRRKTKTRRITIIEAARKNPCFDVEGDTPKEHKKRGRPPKVRDAAEEHAYHGGGRMVSAIPGEPLGS